MKTPGIALTAALGFFIFWGASPSPAQRYQPEKWEECADSELAAAFEKLTGQKAWKVKWQTGSHEADPAKPPENRSRFAFGPAN